MFQIMSPFGHLTLRQCKKTYYIIQNVIPFIGNFSRGFNFCCVRDLPEIAKKIYKTKNKPYYASSLRVLEITKIGLSDN